LEFYELTANADVFFKIAADDGLSVIGNADLPMPAMALESGKAYFFDTDYLGEPVRSVVMAREAVPPLYGDKSVRIIIQVAEGIGDRESFINRMLWRSVGRDLLLIAVVMIIVIVRSEEHTSELQSRENLVCRLLLEKKKTVRKHSRPVSHPAGGDPPPHGRHHPRTTCSIEEPRARLSAVLRQITSLKQIHVYCRIRT